MKITILTLFPEMFNGFLNESIIKRAISSSKVVFEIVNFREYSTKNNKQVDDTPYGGGAGMVLMLEPIVKALRDVATKDSLIILLTPSGKPFKQSIANSLSIKKHLIFICGHYEGFDERILNYVDMEISIGDYVLTGGELPAMVISDTVVRLLDGVINKESYQSDSFYDNLLDYPEYTKPAVFEGHKVPDVLLSGNHELIKEYRKTQAYKKTRERRADLLK